MRQQANSTALYCRLSRDDGGDTESNSIQTQRSMLRRYAGEHAFTIKESRFTMASAHGATGSKA